MPRARALAAVAALPLAALAACSNRPNDLYTYYDDPTSQAAQAQPGVVQGVPSTRAAVPTTTTPRPDAVAARAVLSAADLAAEEVESDPAATPITALPDCGIALGPATARQATWTYPSGAKLRQVVLYAEDTAAFVEAVRDGLDCKSFRSGSVTYQVDESVALPALTGADDQLTWCATSTGKSSCTVVFANGRLATVITVEASTAARAKAAIARVALKAAEALTRGV
ncbi:hypothetical protein [Actinokineospora diospyrosa]|uniref:PknH-like protein n=1 Tax=Actinokineospora diospyrosa TaxID=103728 RepID=A0ABT1I846_9PSEU|nr:hypothetical protein [Actinokineospora diospyrosa]MCP2268561.1 hypothetical protein [Actinokineospora diospyrosa]